MAFDRSATEGRDAPVSNCYSIAKLGSFASACFSCGCELGEAGPRGCAFASLSIVQANDCLA
jgi:hypothetical protein